MKKRRLIFAALGMTLFAASPSGFAGQHVALAQASSDQHNTQLPEHDLPFDYEAAIEGAKARGSHYTAKYLKTCRDTPSGGVLLVPATLKQTIQGLCKVRDFEVRVSTAVWEPTISRQSAYGHTHSGKTSTPVSKLANCRALAAKRITHCEVKVSYCGGSLDCEKVTCNTNFTGCNDSWSGGPFEFYCDTANSWNRHARYENVLAKACPTQ